MIKRIMNGPRFRLAGATIEAAPGLGNLSDDEKAIVERVARITQENLLLRDMAQCFASARRSGVGTVLQAAPLVASILLLSKPSFNLR